MTEPDEIPFARAVTLLAEAFHEPLNSTRLHAYYQALRDRPLPLLLDACERALRECPRFPSPAELRKLSMRVPAELPFPRHDSTQPWALLEGHAETETARAVCGLVQRALAEPNPEKRAALFAAVDDLP